MMVTICFSCCKLMGTMLIQKGNFWIDLLHYLSIGYGINFSGCFSADFFLLSIFTSNSCLYFPFVTFYIIVFSCWVSSVSGMVKRVHVLVNSNCWCFDFSILKAFFSFFLPFSLDWIGFLCCSDNKKCPSVALMFPIGDEATYHNVSYFTDYLACCHVVSSSCSLWFLNQRVKIEDCSYLFRWVAARRELVLAIGRLAKVMKLILCTSQLEMLSQEDSMVGIH